ncbi:Autophagy-related protein 9 [Diplonema papillatum]|nr:Autophagy-related protein 9 [Diplonema papillatum]
MGVAHSLSRMSGQVQGYDSVEGFDELDGVEMRGFGSGPAAGFSRGTRGKHDLFSGAQGGQDEVLHQIYNYWKGKGFGCIVATRVTNFLRCVFAIAFTVTLVVYVNWSPLLHCHGPACEEVEFFKARPWARLTGLQRLILAVASLFAAWWVLDVAHFLWCWNRLRKVRQFYEEELNIAEKEVYFGVIDWGTVATALRKWQERSPANRINMHRDVVLDELNIAQCLMREENIFIALLNSQVVDDANARRLNSASYVLIKHFIGGLLGWGHNKQVARTPAEMRNSIAGARKLTLAVGVGLLFVSPVVLAWYVVNALLQYGLVLKNEPGRLVSRTWSMHALWKFREFNELQHVFEMRMSSSTKVAQEYVDKYPNHVEQIIAIACTFMLTGIVGFMIVLSLLNDSSLVHVSFADKPLLWWISILTPVVVVATAVNRDHELKQGEIFDPVLGFEAISNSTHWRPVGYKDRTRHIQTYREFIKLFPWTLRYYAEEAMFPITTPLLLLFYVLPNIERFVELISRCTVSVPGVGDVLCFSTFDFDEYGSGEYGCGRGRSPEAQFCREGKMEKSFLNFFTMHREYTPPKAAVRVVEQVKSSKYRPAPTAFPMPHTASMFVPQGSNTSATTSIIYPPGHLAHRIDDGDDDNATQLQRMTQLYNAVEHLAESITQ